MGKLNLKKVKPVRVFEQAVDQIRDLIEASELEPGDRLPTEQELCDAFDVSRSSVREALRVLEAEGLIEVRRGAGAFVAPRSSWWGGRTEVVQWLEQHEDALNQILQVRLSLEGLTASLAAKTADQDLVDRLYRIIERQGEIEEGSEGAIEELGSLDVQFHLLLSQNSGNDIANEIITRIVPAFLMGNKAVLYAGQRMGTMVREHRRIVQAIEDGDASGAEQAMREHIRRVEAEIDELLEEYA